MPLGDVSYYTLVNSFGGMNGGDGRCERRHGRREILSVDEGVVEDRRWQASCCCATGVRVDMRFQNRVRQEIEPGVFKFQITMLILIFVLVCSP